MVSGTLDRSAVCSSMSREHGIDACDVCLDQLRKTRTEWIRWLCGEDVNSIDQQLTRMTWDITVYRMVVEAHRLAPDAVEGGKQLNGPVFRLLHRCFSESLLLGFRRLMDKEALNGKHGVYSLWSLLDDIGRNSHLLTRDTIVRLGSEDSLREHWRGNQEYLNDWAFARNKLIDEWIGIAEAERSLGDQIPAKLFDDRRQLLEQKFAPVKPLVDKAIAHAATPESRGSSAFEPMLLDDLYKFHAELCKTAHFIQTFISDTAISSFLATPLYDQFQYLSRPIVADEDVP
jgi:hypothetical protein